MIEESKKKGKMIKDFCCIIKMEIVYLYVFITYDRNYADIICPVNWKLIGYLSVL